MREIPNIGQLRKIALAGPADITEREWDELVSLAAVGLQAETFAKETAELIAVVNEK